MQFALFFAVVFLVTLVAGLLLERLRVPWIFAALLLGIGFAWRNPFTTATNSDAFVFLGELGLHLFLVVIGLSMEVEDLWGQRSFLSRVAITVIAFELVAGSVFIHFVFGTPWMIAVVVALVFATVGEAFLLPILRELRMARTDLGQTILGVGLIDNVVELIGVVLVSVVIGAGATSGGGAADGAGAASQGGTGLVSIAIAFGGLAVATGALWFAPVQTRVQRWLRATHLELEVLLAGVLMVSFLFIWIGGFAHAGAVGAVLAGIALRKVIPEDALDDTSETFRTAVYALLGPILFLWVGVDVDVSFLVASPLLILAKVAIVKAAKVGGSLVSARQEMGTRRATFMGVALAVKFSTSIVLIKLLYERGVIEQDLYTLLIVSKIVFKFIVPFLLAWMARNWDLEQDDEEDAANERTAAEGSS